MKRYKGNTNDRFVHTRYVYTRYVQTRYLYTKPFFIHRYMDCNRTETRLRREQAKKLKEELAFLQAKLDKYVSVILC